MDAIEIIKKSIQTHEEWAGYFEKYPEQEKALDYISLGNAAFHRGCVKNYNKAIKEIAQTKQQRDDLLDMCKDLKKAWSGIPKVRSMYELKQDMDLACERAEKAIAAVEKEMK